MTAATGTEARPGDENLGSMLLSVVVSVLDDEPWIDELLESVRSQDIVSLEIIAVDAGSTDGSRATLAALAREEPRLVVLTAPAHGRGAALSHGASVARGRYLAFANGGDIVPDGAYSALLGSLEDSGSDVAIGDLMTFDAAHARRPTRTWTLFDERKVAAEIASLPEVLRTRGLGNKVFRRDFWRRAEATFTAMEGFEHIVPVTRALLAASAIDVVPTIVQLQRERPQAGGGAPRRSPAASLDDYLREERVAAREIEARGGRIVRHAFASLFVGSEGWSRVGALAQNDEGHELGERAARDLAAILASLPAEKLERLDHRKVVLLSLWSRGAGEQASRLAGATGSGGDPVAAIPLWLDAVETLDPAGDAGDRVLRRVWEQRIAAVLFDGEPVDETDRTVAVFARIREMITRGQGSVGTSRDGGVRQLADAMRRIEPRDFGLWLRVRAVSHIDADEVTRVGRRYRVDGSVPDGADAAQLGLAFPTEAERAAGRARPLVVETRDGRWSATVSARDVPTRSPATAVLTLTRDGSIALPIRLSSTAVVPPSPVASRIAVRASPRGELILVDRGFVLTRAVRGVLARVARISRGRGRRGSDRRP